MADNTYDPFNLRKHPGYYAELVQEVDPVQDIASNFAKTHAYDGGILGKLEQNPHGWGDSPLPYDPTQPELRAGPERPKDHRYIQLAQEASPMAAPMMGYSLGSQAADIGLNAYDAGKSLSEGAFSEAAGSAGAALGTTAMLAAGAFVPGMRGAKPKIAREIDARGFYSPSLEAVKGLGQEKGTVAQFRSMLLSAGGKPKELEAIGFDKAFPDPNAKVSRADIEQFLRDNRVQLGDTTYGELTAADLAAGKRQGPTQTPKFESYSTPGGIPGSYREVVTTLPPRLTEKYPPGDFEKFAANYATPEAAVNDVAKMKGEIYTSSHWPGITNPLLHYRVKDFPGGTRVLDEMQSDWAQAARREDGGITLAERAEWEQRKTDLLRKQAAVEKEAAAYVERVTGEKFDADVNAVDALERLGDAGDGSARELWHKWLAFTEPLADVNTKLNSARNVAPDAPYISNTSDWVDLGLKQALIDAARDPSVSRLAWAPGKVQAERYGLERHMDSLRYRLNDDGTINLHAAPIGRPHEGVDIGDVAFDRLDDHVGRSLGDKIRAEIAAIDKANEGKALKQRPIGVLRNADLKVGGEGMKSFYGDMTPEGYQSGIVGTRLQKLVKGLDPEAARVEPHTILTSDREGLLERNRDNPEMLRKFEEKGYVKNYPSVKITPAMREKILKEGLPLFNIAALSALVSRMLGQPTEDEQ